MKDLNNDIHDEHGTGQLLNSAKEALVASFGEESLWGRAQKIAASRFLNSIKNMGLSILSLSAIKETLAVINNGYRLHKAAYLFLFDCKDLYKADDMEAFVEMSAALKTIKKPYLIIFNNNVRTFNDIAFNLYNGRYYFHYLNKAEEALKPILRRALAFETWQRYHMTTQEEIDMLAMILSSCVNSIEKAADLNISLFFDLIDFTNEKHFKKEIDNKLRANIITDIICLYRFYSCNCNSIMAAAPIYELDVFKRTETVTFFQKHYISREKTFFAKWRNKNIKPSLVTIDLPNIDLSRIYGILLQSGRISMEAFWACRDTLAESFGAEASIIGKEACPFCETHFFEQMYFYRNIYTDRKQRTYAMAFVKELFLSINEQTDGEFFRNTRILTYKLVVSRQFTRYCDQGYSFIKYSPYNDLPKTDKAVFIVNGFNSYRKSLLNEDHISVNLSNIRNKFFLKLSWECILSSKSRLYRREFAFSLKAFLPALEKLKRIRGYPSPSIHEFTLFDAMSTRVYFEQNSPTIQSYNNLMNNIREFLRWAADTNKITTDKTAIMILTDRRYNRVPTNTPIISEDAITKLSEYLAIKARTNDVYAFTLILFQLGVLTPIRISHGCSIQKKELVFDPQMNSYTLYSSNKSTKGTPTEIALGKKASSLIGKAMQLSNENWVNCPQDELKEYLFLYLMNGKYHVMTPAKFNYILGKACKECSLPKYTSKNVRATYMTLAFIEASENGYTNDFQLKTLSYHKSMRTTLENYVNHNEALSALSEKMKRGSDWNRTIAMDEDEALAQTAEEIKMLIDEATNDEEKAQLIKELTIIEAKR